MWQDWTALPGVAMAALSGVRDSGSCLSAMARARDWRQDCNVAGDRMRRLSSGTCV
jgi:hypothetical protein